MWKTVAWRDPGELQTVFRQYSDGPMACRRSPVRSLAAPFKGFQVDGDVKFVFFLLKRAAATSRDGRVLDSTA